MHIACKCGFQLRGGWSPTIAGHQRLPCKQAGGKRPAILAERIRLAESYRTIRQRIAAAKQCGVLHVAAML